MDIRASASSLWVLEDPVRIGRPCRLHQIDPAARRVTRTIAPPKSTWCRLLSVSDEALWLARVSDGRHEMVKLDPTTGVTSSRFAPPEGLEIRGLVIEDPTTAWVIVRVDDSDPRHGALLGTGGGLLQVDLQAGRVVGMLIPTGRANGLIGAAGRSICFTHPTVSSLASTAETCVPGPTIRMGKEQEKSSATERLRASDKS